VGQTGCSIGRGKPGLTILYPIEVSEMKKIHIKEILFLLIISASILVASIAVIFKESTPEWQDYQDEFKEIVAENIGSADLSLIPSGIQQIWAEKLGRVDRCITCHQGANWKGLERVEQPWKSHPNIKHFEKHPIDEFGCTICHGGQGYAVTEYEAHGYAEHWEEPLLSKTIGSEYDPRNPSPLEQINCNYCHRYERHTQGIEYINHAKSLLRVKGCKICHKINGNGGQLGPDLMFEGDKHAESFDFSNFATENPSIFNWHFNHFKSPESVVPGTIMPDMNLQTKDAIALSMLMMSWRDLDEIPKEFLPGFDMKEERTPEEIEKDRKMREGDGAFFVEKSCFVCHSIKAFDIYSPTEKGPDLSFAPDDVRTRFNKTLEEFLFEPTGTMKIILESQIILTDEEKWEAINKITKAYDIVKNRTPKSITVSETE
jgi:cytochrome c2